MIAILLVLAFVGWHFFHHPRAALDPRWGSAIDSYNNVTVYFNGSVSTTHGRNTAPDGYNLGLSQSGVALRLPPHSMHAGSMRLATMP